MKRKTQRQKQLDKEKAWLRQRLSDIAHGAGGGWPIEDAPEDGGGIYATLEAEEFGKFIAGLEAVFCLGAQDHYRKRHATAHRNLKHFDTLDQLTDWLIVCGVRYDD
jgi:hypothetical protein